MGLDPFGGHHTSQMLNAIAQQNSLQAMAGIQGVQLGVPGAPIAMAIHPPHEAHPDVPNTLTLGEIIGHRVWYLGADRLLHSVVASQVWKPGETVDGDPDMGFGVHAWKERTGAWAYARHNTHAVLGRIAMWGIVIEHDVGYRAEHAKIISLDEMARDKSGRTLASLRRRYGLLEASS